MYSLMREYVRIYELRERTKGLENERYSRLLEQAIMPALDEIVSSSRLLYPENEVEVLLDIMEEGMDYVNHETRESC